MSVLRPRLLPSDDNISFDEMRDIQCGDHLLLHNGIEPFWAQVADKKTRGYFDTIVCSKLKHPKQYSYGSVIRCHVRHIHDVLPSI